MELEDLLSCSKQPATESSSELVESSPHPQTTFLRNPLLVIFTNLRQSLPNGFILSGFPLKFYIHFSSLPHACYMPHPAYPP